MTNAGKQGGGRTKGLLVGFAVVIIALLVVIVILLVKGQASGQNVPEAVQNSAEPKVKRNVVVNEENVEEVVDNMASEGREFVEPGYYICNMDTDWTFETGDAVSKDARVDNAVENTNDVYFDVFLANDESTPIYCSPVIPRGSFLEHIALDTPLDAGTYDCVVVYHLIDEEQETVSTLRVAITITVES